MSCWKGTVPILPALRRTALQAEWWPLGWHSPGMKPPLPWPLVEFCGYGSLAGLRKVMVAVTDTGKHWERMAPPMTVRQWQNNLLTAWPWHHVTLSSNQWRLGSPLLQECDRRCVKHKPWSRLQDTGVAMLCKAKVASPPLLLALLFHLNGRPKETSVKFNQGNCQNSPRYPRQDHWKDLRLSVRHCDHAFWRDSWTNINLKIIKSTHHQAIQAQRHTSGRFWHFADCCRWRRWLSCCSIHRNAKPAWAPAHGSTFASSWRNIRAWDTACAGGQGGQVYHKGW